MPEKVQEQTEFFPSMIRECGLNELAITDFYVCGH